MGWVLVSSAALLALAVFILALVEVAGFLRNRNKSD